ncbi:ArsB/NhaD family transporter [Micromonospora zhanjiangensis]|uniref:SLC13 family permease n=1 Tax=Micromonospora zhanjiangensis TaxID=1522057 RepID=A0ABV8KKW3_9ACTN
MHALAWASVAVFTVAYVLIATERIHRVAAALGGAVVMLLIGATDARNAFFSEEAGIDWNVIFLLLGMMLIVAVLRRTGAFEYLAVWAAKRAGGRPFRVLVILVVVTAVASAALDNVTTVLLVAPVTFLVCERLGVPVAPYLIAEAMASNIGGTSTLVGDPPNIIIASRGGLTYNDFVVHLAPFVVLLTVVFVGLCRLLFRDAFRYDPERAGQIASLDERDAIRDGRLLGISLGVLVLVTAAFVLQQALGLEPAVVALIGGLLLLALSRLDATAVAKDVEWPTLVFFAGLFVMVGALVHTGVIEEISRAATEATGDRLLLSSMVLLWGSAVLSGIVDNIPYVATMSPVVGDMVHAAGGTDRAHVLWWALALGADLGGNATAVGASANVVVLGLAERAGHRITFWQFTKYGLVVTLVSILLAVPYLWLRYFVFAG